MGRFCAKLKCSKRTLELKAKRILGTTISKHLTHVRLSAAKRLLASTSLTVAQIAAQTGFCSPSHLGARLIAATGHTAKHYRPFA